MQVSQRFTQFLGNLTLTSDQRTDGITKHSGIRSCLNWSYYRSSSESANSLLVGSWGKSTEIRPPRDIDVLFVLPYEVYRRFEDRSGNKQSQLLQEVKSVLEATYPNTRMRGDGQVVVVPFASYGVEVVPAFVLQNGQYWICNTHDGGKYKTIDPNAEINNIRQSNDATNGNTRDLIRMMKRWQDYCSVPLKSFWIELLAIQFLQTWEHRGKSTVYYDWMVRDFFGFLKTHRNGYLLVPGPFDIIWTGDAWASKAESAYDRAIKAVKYEADGMPFSAGAEWQKIFGVDIPNG